MARVVQVPEPGRSGGPRPIRRNPSRAGIGGFFVFSRGSCRSLTHGNACGYAIFPYSKQHRGRDGRLAYTHKIMLNASTIICHENCHEKPRIWRRNRTRILGVFGDWHSPAWFRLRVATTSHRRDYRLASREIDPIPNRSTVTRTRPRNIKPRLSSRVSTLWKTREYRALYGHGLERLTAILWTRLASSPSPLKVLPSCNARAISLFPLPSPLVSANHALPSSEKPLKRNSGLAERRRKKGDDRRAHRMIKVMYMYVVGVCVCVYVWCARAHARSGKASIKWYVDFSSKCLE